jgi:flagellar M-ring protein FliF
MSLFGQSVTQVTDLIRSMTPAARATTIALLSVIVVSVVFLFRFQTGESTDFLFGGRAFSDRELDAMTTAFGKADLNGWNTSGNRLSVPKTKRHIYLAALADASALPEKFDGYLEDILASSSPFQSRDQFLAQKNFAVQRDLATIVRVMNGIETAAVSIKENKDGRFGRTSRTTVLVAVRAVGSKQLRPEQVEDIRAIVSIATGASSNDVVVADLQGRTHQGGTSASGNEYLQTKRLYEHDYQSKIEGSIGIPGILVGVDVTLDATRSTRSVSRALTDPQPHSVDEVTIKNTVVSGSGRGQPGAESNGVTANSGISIASSRVRDEEKTETRSSTQSALSTQVTEKSQIGLTPTFVSVSVQVPKSHIRRIWREKNPMDAEGKPETPNEADLQLVENAELERIQRIVQRLLPPIDDGRDKWPRIELTTYVDLPVDIPATPPSSSAAIGWLAGNWQTLAMIGTALFALVMVRSALKSNAPAELSSEIKVDVEPDTSEGDGSDADEQVNVFRLRRPEDGPNYKEALTDLVQEDPDAAASILSQWIANSA